MDDGDYSITVEKNGKFWSIDQFISYYDANKLITLKIVHLLSERIRNTVRYHF